MLNLNFKYSIKNNMNKIALITGATAGIGRSTALLLAGNNFNVIITGRRKSLLEDLENEIKGKYGSDIISLNFDVRNNEEVVRAVDSLPEHWEKIDILVNNAGLAAGMGPIQDGCLDDWETMIDTNIKGLLYMTRKIAPLMIRRGCGHIINIGSIAGKEVYPNGSVYCGTKHAVDAISKGMRIDMLEHGIKVTAIHPGMADTEFSIVRFKGDIEKAKKVYEGLTPLYGDDVAEAILYAITRPPHVNINDMIIMATDQASATNVRRNKKIEL